jgi:hypothetical protein
MALLGRGKLYYTIEKKPVGIQRLIVVNLCIVAIVMKLIYLFLRLL